MMGYVYDRRGEPIAYREGDYLFDMQGYAIAYVQSTHVYRLDGEYVGEAYRDMIVDQFLSSPGGIGRVADPGRIGKRDSPGGRGANDYGYPDVSDRLFAKPR